MTLRIVFDEIKRRSNIEKHGYDFAELDAVFFETARVAPAKDDRLMAIGRVADVVVTVVFKPLGTEALAIISMRIASGYERTLL